MSDIDDENTIVESNSQEDAEVSPLSAEQKRQAKIAALLRYSYNQSYVKETKPVKVKTPKEKIKEAVVGIFTILYMMFIQPLRHEKVKQRLGKRLIMALLIWLLACWMGKNLKFDYDLENLEDHPHDVMYQASENDAH